MLYGAGYGVFVSVLPASLAATHGFGPTAVGIFFALFYAAISLSQIVAGFASDRIGRRGILVWGMILAAAGNSHVFPVVPGLLGVIFRLPWPAPGSGSIAWHRSPS
jgi:MFS family permease